MKYTPKEIAETEFDLRRTAPRLKKDMINDLGSVEITSDPSSNEITWNAIPGFNRYRIQITRQSDGELVVNRTVTATSFTPDFDATTGHDRQVFTARRIGQTATPTVTGTSITPSTATVEEGSTLELTGSVQGTGSYNTSGTWTRESGDAIPFTTDGNTITVSPGATDAGQQAVFRFTSDGDNNEFSERTITVTEESSYTPQNSRAGDEAFMQAFWDATQGDDFPTLASSNDLPPSPPDGEIYMISGEIWRYYHTDWYNSGENGWINHGTPWKVTTGWNSGAMSLDDNPAGCTIETVGGELRITEFDMQKVTMDGVDTTGNALAGHLPPEWGNLTKCTYFNIKQNHLRGEIPDTIQAGSEMEWISLAGQMGDVEPGSNLTTTYSGVQSGKRNEVRNLFNSELPSTFDNLTLKILEVRRQALLGTLPEITDWSEFQVIIIDFIRTVDEQPSDQALTGSIPASWQPTSKMQNIEMGLPKYPTDGQKNLPGYTGEIPSTFTDSMTTEFQSYIAMGWNSFTGSFPYFPARNIRRFGMEGGGFTGGFPIEYFQGDNANMWAFAIDENPGLTGPIPTNFSPPTFPTSRSNYNVVSIFRIDNAGFTTLPDWIQEMTGHVQVTMNGCPISQAFPTTLMNQGKIRFVKSSGTDFTGPLGDVDFKATGPWAELRFGSNNLTGGFPESWKSLLDNYGGAGNYDGNMTRMYLNNNELENEIPDWLTEITTFISLRLQENKFVPKDILPTYTDLKNLMGSNYKISPQKEFGHAEDISRNTGQTFTYDYSSKVDPTDSVQWTYQGAVLSDGGRVSGATTDTLTITDLETGDSGAYRLEITNSSLSELGTLVSEPIDLTVT